MAIVVLLIELYIDKILIFVISFETSYFKELRSCLAEKKEKSRRLQHIRERRSLERIDTRISSFSYIVYKS